MISLVFPAYNEEESLEALYLAIKKAVDQIPGQQFEFLFVDDCSRDRTPQILKDLHKKDSRVKSIRFACNAGSHAAISAGLHHAKGDCAIVMAADLQDPPDLIFGLMEEWKKGAKVVWGVRTERKGEAPATRLFSKIYYWLMNRLTSVKTPPSGADVFLADRAAIDAFKQIRERNTSVFMTLAWLGFSQSAIGYVKEARHAGRSKWTLRKKFKLFADSIFSFSDTPVRVICFLSFTLAFGFVVAAGVLGNTFAHSVMPEGIAVMVFVLALGGLQMFIFGIFGEYLWRAFDESRGRPKYIIEYKID